jgi:hypothetical protein
MSGCHGVLVVRELYVGFSRVVADLGTTLVSIQRRVAVKQLNGSRTSTSS